MSVSLIRIGVDRHYLWCGTKEKDETKIYGRSYTGLHFVIDRNLVLSSELEKESRVVSSVLYFVSFLRIYSTIVIPQLSHQWFDYERSCGLFLFGWFLLLIAIRD